MKKKLIAMTAMTAMLAACGGTPWANHGVGASEQVQVQALLQCKEKLSIAGVPQYDVVQVQDGGVVVSAVSGNGVSVSQADSINQCMRNDIINYTTSRQTATGICPPKYTGMFRGTHYCRSGVLFP